MSNNQLFCLLMALFAITILLVVISWQLDCIKASIKQNYTYPRKVD